MREEWTNFAGGKWESDIDVRDFIQKTTHLMTATSLSLKVLQKLQTNFGASSRNSRRKKEPRAAFLIWKLRL